MKRFIAAVAIALLAACSGDVKLLPKGAFEATVDGAEVSLYTLRGGGLTMQVTNYGGRVVALWAPDRDGVVADVAIGYDSLARYMAVDRVRMLGAVVGRYASRIDGGRFSIDGVEYQLATNSGGHTLHGGDKGFDSVVWSVDSLECNSILLSYLSRDMEAGFPGALEVKMRYTLSEEGDFVIDYRATCDRATPINLTHHGFVNLRGAGSGSVLDHKLTVASSSEVSMREGGIPTGEFESVEGRDIDFRSGKTIGAAYDLCFLLDSARGDGTHFAAALYDETSGRRMEVWTSEPAMQLFTGNAFPDGTRGKWGSHFSRYGGVALETEHIPNSLNEPISESHPTTILRPGEIYRQRTVYRFGVDVAK